MNNLKLMMFAAAGLLAPAVAQADLRTSTQTKVLGAATTDLAEVSGTPARLRRQNERQPGNEDTALAFFADGKSGLMFSMNTELNGVRANHRMQLALIPFSLVQDTTTGAVKVEANLPAAKYVTNNIGNEYRNANYPEAFPIDGGAAICAAYNYQANNSNDTKRYVKCFDSTGATVMQQTLAIAKNNDDCSMRQDGEGFVKVSSAAGTSTSTSTSRPTAPTSSSTTSTSRSSRRKSARVASAPPRRPTPTRCSAPGPLVTTSRSATAPGSARST
jgi:hypothetical protein